MKKDAAELFAFFEETDDNENFLRTVIILQQLKFISRSYDLLNQMKVAAKENEAEKLGKAVTQPKKAVKRKLEN